MDCRCSRSQSPPSTAFCCSASSRRPLVLLHCPTAEQLTCPPAVAGQPPRPVTPGLRLTPAVPFQGGSRFSAAVITASWSARLPFRRPHHCPPDASMSKLVPASTRVLRL